MKLNNLLNCIFFVLTLGLVMVFQLFDFNFQGEMPNVHLNKELPRFDKINTIASNADEGYFKNRYHKILDYREEFNMFYDQNFSLEPNLFEVYENIQTSVFNANPIPEKVVYGDEGWLFLGDEYSNVIKKSKGIINFSEKTRLQIKQTLVAHDLWLSEKDIKYYVAVAPNKHSVYGTFLPIKQSSNMLIREQITEDFMDTKVRWIYLGKTFHKPQKELLYFKTDSHWNALGSFLGYQTLISEIKIDFPQVKALQIEDFQRKIDTNYYKDLSKMLKTPTEEISTVFTVKTPKSMYVDDQLEIPDYYEGLPKNYEHRYISSANRLKILVFTDSFGDALRPYLKETFGETVVLIYSKFDKKVIEKEAPDIVIHELAERNIESFLWN